MNRRRLMPLCLALLAIVLAAGPALADQAVQRLDPSCLILAAPNYTRLQKAMLQEQISQTLSAGVSGDSLARLTAMAVAHGVSAGHLAGFYQVLRRVRSDQLPVSTFENKISEGIAKGAPAELILQVVLEKERNYLRAKQLLVGNLRKRLMFDPVFFQVLELTAEGLKRGLPAEGLQRIFGVPASSLEEMGRAVRAYLYTHAIGFPNNEGLDIVVTALEAGEFRECPHNCLGQVIFSARRSGAPPRRIRDELVSGLRNGRNLGEISRILYTTTPQP